MAALSTLEDWLTYYLGTKTTDPMYPQAVRRMLINRAYDQLVSDIHESDPSYITKVNTALAAQSSTSRKYTLPSDFAKITEVRIDNSEGVALIEVRRDELLAAGQDMLAYTIYGPDDAATLETSSGVGAGSPLYLIYRYWPTELSDAGHVPSVIPAKFHDCIALKAAEIAFQLGGEQAVPQGLQTHADDRVAALMFHISRRSSDPKTLRG